MNAPVAYACPRCSASPRNFWCCRRIVWTLEPATLAGPAPPLPAPPALSFFTFRIASYSSRWQLRTWSSAWEDPCFSHFSHPLAEQKKPSLDPLDL
jgi:hypothetical protein